MSTDSAIHERIDAAAESVGSVWPLHSFVTANPLAGFEDRPFHEAVEEAEDRLGADGYPDPTVFRQAWADGRIHPEILRIELDDHGYDPDPAVSLEEMAETTENPSTDDATTATDRVDTVLTKWLAAFLDQGTATWSMPNREAGFYEAVRTVAPHDGDIPDGEAFPTDPIEAVHSVLEDCPVDDWQDVFEYQLSALPGWTGYLKQRGADGGDWQAKYPISLVAYLAVRLLLAERFEAPIEPPADDPETTNTDDTDVPLPEVWLRAWERTYRGDLVDSLTDASESVAESDDEGRPDAQLVFCIDTRSEIIRRHLEAAGDYETHGYAGFFGIPMRYDGYDAEVTVDACPPILDAEHRVADRPAHDHEQDSYDTFAAKLASGKSVIKRLKQNATTVFSYVESAGLGYGAALAARTLVPGRVNDLASATDDRAPDEHEFCAPSVDYNPDSVHELREGFTMEEKVEYAASAFELMGWDQFARVVVFTGHASQTANNPYDSSLDCGACAGNPGGPSARILATICNEEAVQAALRERGIDVPEDTVFLAGEHNTTTDEVELYAEDVPASHTEDVAQLREDLETAREGAAAERLEDMGTEADDPARETERRASDWAQTRPEWGLAGNAGFVIGPRDLTEDLDLDGRSFLHSYDWRTDPDGEALEAIVAGPMVVTQWINTQYYFATVDTAVFGSGSKVTQNPVGNVGVYQGNGGDLMTGLPLQSLKATDDDPYHQPMRLSTVIHAPLDRVTDVLAENQSVAELLDNDWLSLTVVDPTQEHRAFEYASDLEWTPVEDRLAGRPEAQADAAVADD